MKKKTRNIKMEILNDSQQNLITIDTEKIYIDPPSSEEHESPLAKSKSVH